MPCSEVVHLTLSSSFQTLAADKHMEYYRPLLLQILRLGYSLKYTTLNAAEYGVASQRKRLILVAAAPGFILPSWPEPTHRDPNWEYSGDFTPPAQVFVTVRDAIQDLEWRNLRVHHRSADKHSVYCNIPKDGNHPQPSEYALSLGRQDRGLITHHITGRPAKEKWKEERTLGSYDRPLSSECFPYTPRYPLLIIIQSAILTSASGRWKCRHPRKFGIYTHWLMFHGADTEPTSKASMTRSCLPENLHELCPSLYDASLRIVRQAVLSNVYFSRITIDSLDPSVDNTSKSVTLSRHCSQKQSRWKFVKPWYTTVHLCSGSSRSQLQARLLAETLILEHKAERCAEQRTRLMALTMTKEILKDSGPTLEQARPWQQGRSARTSSWKYVVVPLNFVGSGFCFWFGIF